MNTNRKNQPYTSKLKGVAVLLGETSNEKAAEMLPLALIDTSLSQPRKYYDPNKQQQLVKSIEQYGILEPLLIRPTADGRYELVAGERRYRAAQELNLSEIPVVVKKLSDEEAIGIALIENLQRVDLNPIEETEGILKLLTIQLKHSQEDVISFLHKMSNESKGKITQNVLGNPESQAVEEVFSHLGTIAWESFVSSRLPLLNLPQDILDTLREGRIEYTKAKAIARVKHEEQRSELLEEAITQELSLSQIKERISELSSPETDYSNPTAQKTLGETYQKLKKAQLWKKDPKKWRKAQTLLKKLEELLDEESEEIANS